MLLKFAPAVPEEKTYDYYAMENASENVKQAAKQVCPSNEEDGVLVALERLLS